MPVARRNYRNRKKPTNNYLKNKRKNLNNYRRKKQKYASKRRPFVEIKSQSHSELWARLGGTASQPTAGDVITDPKILVNMTSTTSPNSPLITYWFPLWSYLSMTRGIGDQSMLGKSVTAKYLTCKIHFEYPVTPQQTNPRYYIIHGWVTNPLNKTAYTTPTVSDTTRSDISEHIANMTKRDFDQVTKEEFLAFNNKQQKNYKILGYKRIKNNLNISGGINPTIFSDGEGSHLLAGVPADQDFVLKWPMNNKKITYVAGKSLTQNPSNLVHRFPNRAWLPFVMFYCPDAGHISVGHANSPSIAYDNKFWFSDS